MIKFFLHGGHVNKPSESNAAFYRDIISSPGRKEVKVLCVYFARPERRWDDSFAEDRASLLAAGNELGVHVDPTRAAYDTFLQQVAVADIIFFAGGTDGHLKETLLSIPDLRVKLDGKTIAGSSAGANLLAAYFYSSASGVVKRGIGLLQIALLTHSRRDSAHETELREAAGELPLYKIDEEQFVTLTESDQNISLG